MLLDANKFHDGRGHLCPVKHSMLKSFLAAFGCDPEDFEVHVDEDAQLSRLLGLDDRFVTVRQRSSRMERLYVASAYSSWLAELLQDVRAGHFKPATKMRPPILGPAVMA